MTKIPEIPNKQENLQDEELCKTCEGSGFPNGADPDYEYDFCPDCFGSGRERDWFEYDRKYGL